ncbi:MAG: hypothetical protein AAF985_02955 [Bacteroidota bacterium]
MVPDNARIRTGVRDIKRAGTEVIWKRLEKRTEGARRMADVDGKTSPIFGLHKILVNHVIDPRFQGNLKYIAPIRSTDQE